MFLFIIIYLNVDREKKESKIKLYFDKEGVIYILMYLPRHGKTLLTGTSSIHLQSITTPSYVTLLQTSIVVQQEQQTRQIKPVSSIHAGKQHDALTFTRC